MPCKCLAARFAQRGPREPDRIAEGDCPQDAGGQATAWDVGLPWVVPTGLPWADLYPAHDGGAILRTRAILDPVMFYLVSGRVLVA
jgi:hypothetical protein